MSRKIYGRPIATPINLDKFSAKDAVKTVNGIAPDEDGNVEVDGGLVVTVTGTTASHSSAEIATHVKTGSNVVLKKGYNWYNFLSYDEDVDAADFIRVDAMDAEYFEKAQVSGNRVFFNTMPFALDSEVVKTVNGVKPDENGDVTVEGGGSAGLVVTVTGNTASHSDAEIEAHVKAGGTVVLQRGADLYNFVNYSNDAGAACFVEVDAMEGEYFQTATVSGHWVTFYKMPFATEQWVRDNYQLKGNYLESTALATAINTALAQAKASGEFNGQPGKDGTSVTVKSVSESTADGGSNVVAFSDGKTLTVKNGNTGAPGKTPVKGVDYFDGAKGDKGDTGATGPSGATGPQGAQGIEGLSIYCCAESPVADPETEELRVSVGSIECPDDRTIKEGDLLYIKDTCYIYRVLSAPMLDSVPVVLIAETKGDTGATGPKGDKGDTGATGPAGADGKDGTNGKDGADGKTPVKGTDYFTATDKAEMVNAVISALPVYAGEVL